jgi:ribosome maturation factor RimP
MDFSVKRPELESKFVTLCQQVVSTVGLELYDLEFVTRSQLLRIFVIDPQSGTATLDNCVKVDRAMTPHIEEESWMPEELTLEVSSPGIYRNLRLRKHFDLSVGKRVALNLYKKSEEWGREIVGSLHSVDEESLIISPCGAEPVSVAIENIKKAKLMPEL